MDITQQSEIIHPAVQDISLTAVLPQEMVAAQTQLIAWCENKIAVERADVDELRLATDHAKSHKWKSATLESQWKKALKRLEYYVKIKIALEAGYYIVPNFPIEMFAIRKQHGRRPKGHSSRYWEQHQQKSQELPAGEGDYRNPFPIVVRSSETLPDGKTIAGSYPREWDQFEFPINMAKPLIMSVTQTALAMKVFDRVGVMPSTRRKQDPVIIGQIINKSGYTEKTVSFMIAWHLNTNVL